VGRTQAENSFTPRVPIDMEKCQNVPERFQTTKHKAKAFKLKEPGWFSMRSLLRGGSKKVKNVAM
jgi:hypothetical protein